MLTMRATIISIIGSILIGYFIGCVNLTYIIAKFKGFDIRTVGSGNAGASNAVIVFGKTKGIVIALIDIFKAYLAVKLAMIWFPDAVTSNINYASLIAGASSMVGHMAPFYMGFRGGKGLAALGGTVLATDYRLFFALLAIAVVIALVTDYICYVPVSMVVIFPLALSLMHMTFVPMIIFAPVIVFVWYKHRINFARIKAGKELKFHFLWNRSSESDRMGIEDDGKEVLNHVLDETKMVK